MRVSFFGHSDFSGSAEAEGELCSILREVTESCQAIFYFGGYGGFDDFALRCAAKVARGKAKFYFVTPYIKENYLRNKLEFTGELYDGVIYPELEKVIPRFAISARNKWIVENSDLIITYINRKYGGAYAAYRYAMRSEKEIINIAKTQNASID